MKVKVLHYVWTRTNFENYVKVLHYVLGAMKKHMNVKVYNMSGQ